ncbi:MAG: tetratricopeptide repeat protein, partial [Magnetococcales bacterium]|nr:tetratricopeptide repeat protein [Magnetococcales bacterium]
INLLGIVAQRVNRHDLAVGLFGWAINIDNNRAILYFNLATSLYPLGEKDEAVNNLNTALKIEPENSRIKEYLQAILSEEDSRADPLQQGIKFHNSGRIDEAIHWYQKALEKDPENATALSNMGCAQHSTGNFDAAVTSLRKAIAIKENFAEAYNNLGNSLQEQGNIEEAIESYQKAISIKTDFAEAYSNLGNVLQKQLNLGVAVACYQKAILISPNHASYYSNLGSALQKQDRLDEAVVNFRKAIAIRPDYAEAYYNLGDTFHKQAKFEKAITSYHKAIAINSGYAEAYNNLGVTLKEQVKLDEAIASYQKAIAINPNYVEAHSNLGISFQEQGKFNEAVSCFQKAITIKPDHKEAYSNFLFLISYYCLYSNSETVKYHQLWDTVNGKLGLENSFSHLSDNRADKRLKIAYLSPDFKQHPVSNFMRGVLQNHNRNNFKVYCYANVAAPDAITAEFQKYADVWQDTLTLSDYDLAQQIYNDGIDILIDLSGHTNENRLKVFTYKPAPIQTTYLGYCTTTGLQAMDYWLTDRYLTPENTQEKSVETVVRLPSCWVCYKPNKYPPIALSDRDSACGVVFGSFNHLSKINQTVAMVWSQILLTMPTAKLILKTKQLVSLNEQERISQVFAEYGIKRERLILQKDSSSYLEDYGLVDIVLDPFPRTGGATTADALWMGVPVITLAGQRMIERQGVSLLTAVSKEEWIAETVDEYITKAVELAGKGRRDEEQRLSLHNLVINSQLCNYTGFARDIEQAYRQMWHSKCVIE